MNASEIKKLLADPFEPHDIKWRVQQSGVTGNSKPWVLVIPYVDNRAIQQRLDDVLGMDGWENIYQPSPCGKGYLCGLRVKLGNEWVTKWDGAEYTNVESLKGAISDSMKRAAVQLGIGRYLYSLEPVFAQCTPVDSIYNCDGKFISIPIEKNNKNSPRVSAQWFPPELPEWALPTAKFDKYLDAITQAESLEDMRKKYESAYKYAAALNRKDLRDSCVQAKDKRKEYFEQKIKAEKEQSREKFEKEFRRMIESIKSADNESVANINADRSIDVVKGVCRARKINPAVLIEQIKDALNSRVKELNQRN